MKVFIYILITVAILLSVYNATKLDFNNLFEGESSVAAVSIMTAACAIVLLLILRVSHIIKQKNK